LKVASNVQRMFSYLRKLGLTALLCLAGTVPTGASETGPVIVIPGRAGVPVMMDGRDVSYSVIEGDWGLNRPSQTNPTIIYHYWGSKYFAPPAAHFFPSGDGPVRVGRKEVDIPRPPEQPESYIRSWGVQSDPTPATSPTPLDTPPMIVAPEFRGPRRP
jgi:hypothetical protein